VPRQNETVESETATQLARTGFGHPITGPELAYGISESCHTCHHGLDQQRSSRILIVQTWTYTHEVFPSRFLCKEDLGTIRIK
jgi:hypothetical protein